MFLGYDVLRSCCGILAEARRFFTLAMTLVAFGIALGPVSGQGLAPDQLLQLQQGRSTQTTTTQPSVSNSQTILEPVGAVAPQGVSRLELILSERAGVKLQQYGYDQLGGGRSITLPQLGAVQDSYVLGMGDEIVVTLRGQENNEYRTTVDRDGQVTLPRLNPVSASGRTFGQFRQDIMNAIHRAYVSTEGFVTIGRVRQISVLVSGEVGSPGVRTLTGLSSPVDALLVSGGVRKSGSLRNIHIVRGGREIVVDLYSILVGRGGSSNMALADGDKIVVPTIGATIAIAGESRRSGIYELAAGRSAISVREAVAMAGGTTVPGTYSVSVLRTLPDGKRQFVDVTTTTDSVLKNGEIVFLKSSVNVSLNRVTLSGAVRSPGVFALAKYRTLHDLLPSSESFDVGAYMLLGIVDRTDPTTLQRIAIPFSPLHVVQGRQNIALTSDDTVRILTRAGMRSLLRVILAKDAQNEKGDKTKQDASAPDNSDSSSQASANGMSATPGLMQRGATQSSASQMSAMQAYAAQNAVGQTTGADASRSLTGPAPSALVAQAATGAPVSSTGVNDTTSATVDTDVGGYKSSDTGFFGRSLVDAIVTISGAVHEPGSYMVAPDTTVAEALTATGGLSNDVDLTDFELTTTTVDNNAGVARTERTHFAATSEQLKNVVLKPHDSIIFRTVYTDRDGGVVTLEGQVRYPGPYTIMRGERLSSVLMRAGGLTSTAYPYGTVFLRKSVAATERTFFQRQAQEIENQLIVAMTRRDPLSKMSPDSFTAMQTFVGEIRSQKPIGRVVVTADPAVLAANPGVDPLLEPGDDVVVPPRPYTVAVLGEVLQPGNIPFRSDMSPDDYIEAAGGYSSFADDSQTVLVLPDGSARRIAKSWFHFDSETVPPGSAIFIPRDIGGVDFHQALLDFTNIVSQLAVSAASLAVLSTQIK